MKRVYVAGAYNAGDVIGVLDNMRRGMRASTEVMLAGFAPFCPWMDYHYKLMLREGEDVTLQDFYDYSMAWLEASDFVLVLPNSEHSKGVNAEIARAKELGIPVFQTVEELRSFHFGNS